MEKFSLTTIENNTEGKNESLMTLWPFLAVLFRLILHDIDIAYPYLCLCTVPKHDTSN